MSRQEFIRALRALQGDRCGICASTADLVLDHHHESGFIRGFLCEACNVQEGFHGRTCSTGSGCVFCMWRSHPAAAALGVTFSYNGRSEWDDIGGYRPMVEVASAHRRAERTIADAIDAVFTKAVDA